jgi:YVTN family beta-propeller protein
VNGSGPAIVDTINLPGAQPLAVGVYETGNKIYVADDNSGNLIVLHGTTREVLRTIPVGAAVFDIAVDESMGKVYTASSDDPVTTGIGDGNGLVSVIDAETDSIVTQIDPAGPDYPGKAKFFTFGHDEAHDRLYLTFQRPFGGAIGEIGADNTFTTIGPTLAAAGVSGIEVNPVTNTAYIAYVTGNDLMVIDGSTLGVTTEDLGYTGGGSPLDIAVNEVENKVYLTMIYVPGQGQMGILALDRDDGSYVFRGADDLEPLTFNPATNRLFSGVQVGQHGAVVDGATDALTYVDLGGSGMGAGDVRRSTDNAYFASTDETFVVNGSTLRHRKFSAAPTGGGIFASSVTIDQSRGLVYVVNDDHDGVITVIHDAEIPAPTLSVNDVTIAERDAGSWAATLTVSLSEKTGRDVTFHYATTPGTATPGADYTAVAGTGTIPAESLRASVTVPVLGDSRDEPDQTFFLVLTDPVDATIADGRGVGTIADDDPRAAVSIRDASTIEGDSGRHKLFFRVVLNAPSEKPVAVKFRTFDGTAKTPSDYTGQSGTVRFAKGVTAKRVFVYVKGDRRNEPREHFLVKLQGPVNASLADRSARGLIRDDD